MLDDERLYENLFNSAGQLYPGQKFSLFQIVSPEAGH
jgi:hypothetical protein